MKTGYLWKLTAATVLCLATPGGAWADDAPQRGGTLRVAISQMAPSPDPVVTTFGTNWMTASVACEGLFAVDANWQPQPMLADSFGYSSDGKTLTVKLRKGIKFHSGADMTSADAAASLNRFMNAAGIGASLKGVVDSIETPDPATIVFHLKAPTPIVPGLLTITQAVIMSKASLDGATPTVPVKQLDCTGPYQVTSFEPDQGVVLKRFGGYQSRTEPSSAEAGAKHAWADEIDLKLEPEASVRRDSLLTGEVDIATELPTDFYDAVEGNPDTQPIIIKNTQSLTVVFNTKQGPAADVNLRRAIYYALDMDPIMMAADGDPKFYTLDPSWIPDPNSIWHTDAGVPAGFGKAQPDKVKAYLAKSNYKGEPIHWLTATEQHTKHYLTAVTAAQQLQAYGINVDIKEEPIATYIQDRADPAKMDAFSSFLPTYIDPVSIAFLNASFPGFWTDPRKMELMNQLATTIDTKKRVEIFKQIHALAYDEFPFIKYGVESGMEGIRKGTLGVSSTPVGGNAYYNVAPPRS